MSEKDLPTLAVCAQWSEEVCLKSLESQFVASPHWSQIFYVRHRGWTKVDSDLVWQDGPRFVVNRQLGVLYFEPPGSRSSALPAGSIWQRPDAGQYDKKAESHAASRPHLREVLASHTNLSLNVATLALRHYLKDHPQMRQLRSWICHELELSAAQAAFFALMRISNGQKGKPYQMYVPQNFQPHWKRYLQNLGFALYRTEQLPSQGGNQALTLDEATERFRPVFTEFCEPHGRLLLQSLQQHTPVVPASLFA